MMNGDVIAERTKGLWGFANVLHISSVEVDNMRAVDFFNYVFSLEKYYRKLEEQRQEQEARAQGG